MVCSAAAHGSLLLGELLIKSCNSSGSLLQRSAACFGVILNSPHSRQIGLCRLHGLLCEPKGFHQATAGLRYNFGSLSGLLLGLADVFLHLRPGSAKLLPGHPIANRRHGLALGTGISLLFGQSLQDLFVCQRPTGFQRISLLELSLLQSFPPLLHVRPLLLQLLVKSSSTPGCFGKQGKLFIMVYRHFPRLSSGCHCGPRTLRQLIGTQLGQVLLYSVPALQHINPFVFFRTVAIRPGITNIPLALLHCSLPFNLQGLQRRLVLQESTKLYRCWCGRFGLAPLLQLVALLL
mmetsp:Transcript_85412/g.204676  ORF Transcript_85412/g.204676 Transcript_85412/m.204676 type:complete len:292 (-) Transcript_85412:1963-2838(-)